MKPKLHLLVASLLLATTSSALATVRYVNVNNASPTPPYTNWATAATNIQPAVDAAAAGDEVVVTNGVYAGGGAVDPNGDYRCVVVDQPLILQSVNGPYATMIVSWGWAKGGVYLANNAVMAGFTLTNGSASIGGGAYCESTNAMLTDCVLTGNSTREPGGGAYGGTLNNCVLTGNWAPDGYGGGACDSILNNCTLTDNSAAWWGGDGGGAYECTLNNCTLTGNSASYDGGGAYDCTLNNCIVYFNSAPVDCNYDASSTLNYCCSTPLPTYGVGNISADPQLASSSRLSVESPCIGAGSTAYLSGTDIDGDTWANPPSMGCDEYYAGALTGPLIVAVSANYTNVAKSFPLPLTALIQGRTDLSVWNFGDGDVISNHPYASHAWTALGDYPVTLRAYNSTYRGGVAASVTVHVMAQPVYYVSLSSTSPAAPHVSWATAATNLQDAVDAASVPGTLVLVTNGVYAPVAVNTPLTLQSVNGPGVSMIDGGGIVQCVYLTKNATMVGFTLTNGYGGGLGYGGGVYCESVSVVLNNCTLTGNSAYDGGGAYGGTLNNCTVTGNNANAGGGTYGCTLNNCVLTGNLAYEDDTKNPIAGAGGGADSSTLNKCTLTGNEAYGGGGGTCGCTLNNCTLTGNFAYSTFHGAGSGGGACDSVLNNCTLTGNFAYSIFYGAGRGGGACDSVLNNCTLTGNSADQGGGAYGDGTQPCTLNNCIVYFNSDSVDGGNYDPSSTLNYCCTTPMPDSGVGNITNAPLFVNYAGGNLRLQSNSPCINSGNNAYVFGSTDLDGNPRIQGGTVDIGAYEYQAPVSTISYAWLQQYGLPTDGSADGADTDGTGMNNWQKWIAGLNPTNALSVLRMLPPGPTNTPLGRVLTWQSVNTRTYYLQSSTNLASQPAFITIQSNIIGQAGTTSYTDTTATNAGPYFYRVGVEN